MSLMEPTIMGLLPHERSESGFGHAVAEILAKRFPVHTAKQLATELSRAGPECTLRTAENILAGHLSARTITRLIRTFGLGLVIEAGARVTGTSLEQYIIDEARRAQHEQRRWEAEVRHFAELEARLGISGTATPPRGHRLDRRAP